MKALKLSLLLLFIVVKSHAGNLPTGSPAPEEKKIKAPVSVITLPELKLQKRFGIGLSAGGPLSVLGMEADINITEVFSVGLGLGTGLDYSTSMLKARYFLPGRWVSPYFAAGLARWWTNGTKEKSVSPSVLRNKFLSQTSYNDGFDIALFYPAIGVQYMHPMGFAISFEVEYLFRLFTLANGTYAGLGVHWYF